MMCDTKDGEYCHLQFIAWYINVMMMGSYRDQNFSAHPSALNQLLSIDSQALEELCENSCIRRQAAKIYEFTKMVSCLIDPKV